MCGIAGVFTSDSNISHLEISKKMVGLLHHRGPDFTSTTTIDDFCTLSHARLKIIDLSDSANQPMQCYQKKLTIVFNGEIYNYKQLKLELQRVAYRSADKPYPFQTQSDTEVILAAYHRWGEECVKYLDGMFAFAIYDHQNKTLFLARDRQGKKPLYYILKNNVFAFASEIRALLSTDFSSKKLNPIQLFDYFQYQTNFSPHTLIEDIQLLEPASTLKVQLNNNQVIINEKKKYWKPVNKVIHADEITYEEAKKHIRELLFSAVEKRLVSDVPIGAFLSGGIDSSAIVGIMKKYFYSEVNTFHITTKINEFSEHQYAQSLAEIYNTHHHDIIIDEKQVLSLIPEALEKMDYPSGDGINTYIVSKYTKNAGITVALSGLGGDELFAGYPQFKIIRTLHHLDVIDFSFIRKFFTQVISPFFGKHDYRLKILMQSDELSADKIFPYYRQLFSNKNLPLQHIPLQTFFHLHHSEKYLLKNKHLLSYISLLEMYNYMQHVLLRDTDQMSMANALEVRAPFLDTALVSFVLSLPDEYKYPATPKKLLTDAIQDILPQNIIHRKKMGFVLPFQSWMRKDLKNFCDEKIKNIAQQYFIDKNKLLTEWNKYQTGKHNHWWMFWHIIVLQNWIEKNNIATCEN